jgi:hypothetical protein
MFDAGEVPWGEEPPFHASVFVVTHRSRDVLERQGGTSFTFVTEGLERARHCENPDGIGVFFFSECAVRRADWVLDRGPGTRRTSR